MVMKPHSSIPLASKTLEEMSCTDRRVRGARSQANGLTERLGSGDSVLVSDTRGIKSTPTDRLRPQWQNFSDGVVYLHTNSCTCDFPTSHTAMSGRGVQ